MTFLTRLATCTRILATASAFALVSTASMAQSAAQQAQAAQGAQGVPARQDPAQLREAVEQYLHTQAAGLPGQVSIAVGAIDTRTSVAACAALQAFMPNGSRPWGRTTVGVRCAAPSPWTLYIPATVRVQGDYYVAAAPLAQGQAIGQHDIVKARGDLTALPAGIVTDPSQALGRTLAMSVTGGTPLRQDALRSQPAVQPGQLVRIVAGGNGFSVTTEGRALAGGTDGQPVQARTASGQVVSGIARMGGVVAVTY